MATKDERFAPGEWVAWDTATAKRYEDTFNSLQAAFGDGPFLVAVVRDATENPSAEHPQIVRVLLKNKTGETSDMPFSGMWFIHSRH